MHFYQNPRSTLFCQLTIGCKAGIGSTTENPFCGSNAKSGTYSYYYNRTTDKNQRKSVKKSEIEEIVCNRVKQYLEESGTLEKVMKAALKNTKVGLPLIEEEIPKFKKEIAKLEKVQDRFSEAIRNAALNSDTDLSKVIDTLVTEKEKADHDLEEQREILNLLLEKKNQVETSLQHKTLADYLQAALINFDNKTGIEKKALVQAIIPEVIIHEDNSIELKINPDPAEKTSHLPLPCDRHTSGHKVALLNKWRGGRVRLRSHLSIC